MATIYIVKNESDKHIEYLVCIDNVVFKTVDKFYIAEKWAKDKAQSRKLKVYNGIINKEEYDRIFDKSNKVFFIPKINDYDQAYIYNGIKEFIEDTIGIPATDIRIYKIKYVHNSNDHEAEIGKPATLNFEKVYAIFKMETDLYCICTENRGAKRGHPLLVSKSDTLDVEYFKQE